MIGLLSLWYYRGSCLGICTSGMLYDDPLFVWKFLKQRQPTIAYVCHMLLQNEYKCTSSKTVGNKSVSISMMIHDADCKLERANTGILWNVSFVMLYTFYAVHSKGWEHPMHKLPIPWRAESKAIFYRWSNRIPASLILVCMKNFHLIMIERLVWHCRSTSVIHHKKICTHATLDNVNIYDILVSSLMKFNVRLLKVYVQLLVVQFNGPQIHIKCTLLCFSEAWNFELNLHKQCISITDRKRSGIHLRGCCY